MIDVTIDGLNNANFKNRGKRSDMCSSIKGWTFSIKCKRVSQIEQRASGIVHLSIHKITDFNT